MEVAMAEAMEVEEGEGAVVEAAAVVEVASQSYVIASLAKGGLLRI